MMKRLYGILLLRIFLFCIPVCAPCFTLFAEQGAEKQAEQKRGKFFIFPFVFYTPETAAGGGVAFNYSYWTWEKGLPGPPSTLNLVFILTGRRQFNCELKADNAWKNYTLYSSIDLRMGKSTESFYGIGNNTIEGDEEKYTHSSVVVYPTLQWRVFPHFFAGAGYEFEYSVNSDLEDGGLLQSGEVPGSSGGVYSGVGFMATCDTTNSRFFPRRGGRYFFSSWFYHSIIGSDNDFSRYTFDARRYVSLFSEHVLAMQIRYTAMSGDVPFEMLSLLGGRSLMRGYFLGRYRDRNMLVFQIEYRMPLLWRVGAVGFLSAGDVAPRGKNFELDELKYSAGAGLRVMMNAQEKINLRIDFAFGKDSRGVYVTLFEAF
jgi:outer membrane protein assembly factor BamA